MIRNTSSMNHEYSVWVIACSIFPFHYDSGGGLAAVFHAESNGSQFVLKEACCSAGHRFATVPAFRQPR